MALDNNKFLFEALTYDDVLLLPAYSAITPKQAVTKTKLTRNIDLNIPLVSAAMDTVSEHQMAISMAQMGGLAFIHKNMTIDQQAAQVRRVKRSESGMITDPITLNENSTLRDALQIMQEYKIGGIPVVNEDNKLVGIITNRDLRFQDNLTRSVTEIMTKENLVTASEGITLEEAEDILQENKIEKLPIISDNNDLIGLITYRDILKRKDKPNACKDEMGRLRVGAAVGVTGDVLERVTALVNAGVQ